MKPCGTGKHPHADETGKIKAEEAVAHLELQGPGAGLGSGRGLGHRRCVRSALYPWHYRRGRRVPDRGLGKKLAA